MDRKHKILVVDDDPETLNLLEALLTSHGYEVALVSDGGLTVDAAKEEKPDIILLDIMMPVSDGYTVLRRIREESGISNIPVIMITALGDDANKVIASICSASAYVTKPIDHKELFEKIACFLANSESR